jgi:hypothetical protein
MSRIGNHVVNKTESDPEFARDMEALENAIGDASGAEQQDLWAARKARDEALSLVDEPPYSDRALLIIPQMKGRRVTGEDIRLTVERIIGQPHHHNSWGAIINAAVRRGLLIKTGDYTQMKTKKSHARVTPTYIVI